MKFGKYLKRPFLVKGNQGRLLFEWLFSENWTCRFNKVKFLLYLPGKSHGKNAVDAWKTRVFTQLLQEVLVDTTAISQCLWRKGWTRSNACICCLLVNANTKKTFIYLIFTRVKTVYSGLRPKPLLPRTQVEMPSWEREVSTKYSGFRTILRRDGRVYLQWY